MIYTSLTSVLTQTHRCFIVLLFLTMCFCIFIFQVVCKYLEDPVLFSREGVGMVKFDIRYMLMLRSVQPLRFYAYNVFWLRFANRYSIHPSLPPYSTPLQRLIDWTWCIALTSIKHYKVWIHTKVNETTAKWNSSREYSRTRSTCLKYVSVIKVRTCGIFVNLRKTSKGEIRHWWGPAHLGRWPSK